MLNKKIILGFFVLSFGILGFVCKKASADVPKDLPLVQLSDLEYLGAFRLPQGENGDSGGYSFGGYPIAYNPTNNSLFVGSRIGKIGEVSIPTPINNQNVNDLSFSKTLQNLKDPTEGKDNVLEGGKVLSGLFVLGNKIYGSEYIYYDASNSARVSHFSRGINLEEKSATPLYSLWKPESSGFVSGWITSVPTEWSTILGGSLLSGNCCLSIITRTSFGPAAFSWNPEDLGGKTPISATPLLYYPASHPTLGPWDGSNPVYGGTTTIGGMVIIKGTRSLLFFGMNGVGTFCYAVGTSDKSQVGEIVPDSGGEKYCYDPASASKGQHAYPYNYQVWAYDLNDLALVKKGLKQPWEITPYATWKLDLPGPVFISGIGGVAYDEARQLLYISQARADVDRYSSRALIHVYKVNVKDSSFISTTSPKVIPNTKPIKEIKNPTSQVKNELISASEINLSTSSAIIEIKTKNNFFRKILKKIISFFKKDNH